MLIQMPMHIKAIPQQMRLMSPPLPEALKLRLIEVILQNRHVVWVRALLDNHTRSFAWAQTAHVGEALLRDDDVEIVLRLVDVRAHWHDAGHARGICFAGPGRGRVHDAVLGGAQEIRRPA